MTEFAKLWKVQYLQKIALLEHVQPTIIKIGDRLLLKTDKRRGEWPLAEVLDRKFGPDQVCRSVLLKFSDGSSLWRPVNNTVLLSRRG